MPLQPIPNYISNLPNPAEQVQKDLQFYMNMQQAQVQNNLIAARVQEHQMKVKAMQEKQIADARTYAYLKELSANPTVENIRRATIMLPDKANELKVSLDSYTAEQKQKAASDAMALLAAVDAGDIGIATKLIDGGIEANTNSGNSGVANSLRVLKRQLERGNKAGVLSTSALIVANTLPPEQLAAAYEQLSNREATRRSREALAAGQEVDTRFKPAMFRSQINQNNAAAVGSLATAASSREAAATSKQEREQNRELFPLLKEQKKQESAEAGFKARSAAVDAETKELTGFELAYAKLRKDEADAEKATHDANLGKQFEGARRELENKILRAQAKKEEVNAEIAGKTGLKDALTRSRILDSEAGIKGVERRFAADRTGTQIALDEARTKQIRADILETARKAKSPERSQVESTLLTKYSTQGTGAIQSATRMREVADKFAKSTAHGGVRSWVRDQLVKVTGSETPWDVTKKEYVEIANAMAMERLPRGPASNADLEFAKAALLSPNAQPSTIARALRILASIQEGKAREADFRNKWVWNNRHEGPADKAFAIHGVKVQPGQSLQEVMFSPEAGSLFNVYKHPSRQELSTQAQNRLNLYRGLK